ncbi:MAG: hypothetical protein ABSG35_04665 [Syntrophobacteraceae bacterium]
MIGRIIFIADNGTDTSPFSQPVQVNGADAFKLVLIHISTELNGLMPVLFIPITMR